MVDTEDLPPSVQKQIEQVAERGGVGGSGGSSSSGHSTIQDILSSRATEGTASEVIQPTTSQQFQASLFERQGFKVVSGRGKLTATRAGEALEIVGGKITGRITAPESAIIQASLARGVEESRAKATRERTPTRSSEFQERLLKKQGFTVTEDKGKIIAKREGEALQIVGGIIGGRIKAPPSAILSPAIAANLKRKPQFTIKDTVVMSGAETSFSRRVKDERRTGADIGKADGTTVASGSVPPVEVETRSKGFFERPFGEGLAGIPQFFASAATGFVKPFFAPAVDTGIDPVIEVGQSKIFGRKGGGSLVQDPDIQSAAFITALRFAPKIVQTAFFAGFVGEEVQKVTQFSGAERGRAAGTLAFVAATQALGVGIPLFKSTIVKQKQLVSITLKPNELTAKEFNALQKLQDKSEALRTKEFEKISDSDLTPDSIIIDLNKLKPKQAELISRLQKQDKIESQFEIEFLKKGEAPIVPEVGFSIPSKGGVSELERTSSIRAESKLVDAFQKKQSKARDAFDSAIVTQQEKLLDPKLEQEIRAEMKRTGKTAAEILKEKSQTKEFKILQKKVDTAKKKLKELGIDPATSRVPLSADPFAPFDLTLRGGFPDMFPRRQQTEVVLVDEIVRGKKPVEVLEFPSAKQLSRSIQISRISSGARAISKTTPLLGTSSLLASGTLVATSQRTGLLSRLRQLQIQETRVGQAQLLGTVTGTSLIQSQQVRQEQVQEQTQRQLLETRLQLRQEQVQRTTGIVKVTPRITTIIPKLKKIKSKSPSSLTKSRLKAAYDVMVRERGKLLKVNKKGLPFNKAFNRGSEIVDNSTAATFMLRKLKKQTRIRDDLNLLRTQKFREKARNKFVEKNLFRIDSAGELRGITAKGLLALRKKGRRTRAKKLGGFI